MAQLHLLDDWRGNFGLRMSFEANPHLPSDPGWVVLEVKGSSGEWRECSRVTWPDLALDVLPAAWNDCVEAHLWGDNELAPMLALSRRRKAAVKYASALRRRGIR